YFFLFDRRFGIGGLGAAYLVSWGVQLLTLVVPLLRKKYKYKFSLNLKNPAFAKAMKMTLPIMAGSWLLPFGMLVGQRFLSFSEFYINAFDYSTKLFLLVSGILTHSICNYLFPSLAKSANEPEQFAKIVKSGLSAAFFVILPVACLVYVLKGEAVAVLFGHGKFRETAGLATSTAQMVAALAPAMMTFSMIEILNRVFYSKGQTRFPMAASLTGIAANIALCWLFMSKLGFSPIYVALSLFLCQALAAAVLTFALKKKIKGVLDRGFLKNIAKIALSASIMLLLAQTMHHMIKTNAFEAGIFANIAVAAGTAAVGACIYLGLNLIFGTEEAKFIAKILKRK
ncbi:MAG: polysaccharide biosynthesis C-terminal domain-containing protein, partial [Oscillospiraceae bacterium]|nr:polysaccharide biosynthesis C-terminal domain-containing protein [Oscillospiraceae bacterium]